MLKNFFSRRHAEKYTIVVDHVLGDEMRVSHATIEDAMRMHVVNVYAIIRSLGHHPGGLTAALKRGHVSARATLWLKSDEEAARLLALIGDKVCEHATTRIMLGVRTEEVHDHPLERLAA